MKKSVLAVLVLTLVVATSFSASAQSKFSLGVGGDVLIPTGTFGDAYSIGFGGSVRGQYDFTPMVSGGANLGYYTWSAKDVPAGYSKPTFSGVPFRVYGKYYFMPPKTPRVYGMFELGLFFWSAKVDVPVYGTLSTTGSDFNIAPGFGIEIPAGNNLTMDLSARYDIVMTSGNSRGDLGVRVGVNFGL
jgi:hypothetical protein